MTDYYSVALKMASDICVKYNVDRYLDEHDVWLIDIRANPLIWKHIIKYPNGHSTLERTFLSELKKNLVIDESDMSNIFTYIHHQFPERLMKWKSEHKQFSETDRRRVVIEYLIDTKFSGDKFWDNVEKEFM